MDDHTDWNYVVQQQDGSIIAFDWVIIGYDVTETVEGDNLGEMKNNGQQGETDRDKNRDDYEAWTE